jgi:hypothetical protein
MNPISKDTLPLLSFIIGMGVAIMLFHKPFKTRPTLSLPLESVHNKVVSYDGKCYRYSAEDSHCEILSSR